MNSAELWALSPEQFNEWRRNNDYPIIWKSFIDCLPFFSEWLAEQKIDKDIVFSLGLARFIASQTPLSICKFRSDNKIRLYDISSSILEALKKSKLIERETHVRPYTLWITERYSPAEYKQAIEFLSVKENNNGQPQILKNHQLLCLGGIIIKSPLLSGRLLDFTNLDELSLDGIINNTQVYLWFCSMRGVKINGGGQGLYIYNSITCDERPWIKKRGITLESGLYQDINCRSEKIKLSLYNATLKNSSVSARALDMNIEHVKTDNFKINYLAKGKINHNQASTLYRNAKRTSVILGDTVNAGEYYYLEKKHELISLLQFSAEDTKSLQGKVTLYRKIYFFFFRLLRLISTLISYLTWGFGERPARSLISSLLVMLSCSLIYYFSPESTTYNNLGDSLYFSIVTFVTLGYGDIYQRTIELKMTSSLESAFGVVLNGLFLAGFASKTKQY